LSAFFIGDPNHLLERIANALKAKLLVRFETRELRSGDVRLQV